MLRRCIRPSLGERLLPALMRDEAAAKVEGNALWQGERDRYLTFGLIRLLLTISVKNDMPVQVEMTWKAL